MGIPACRSSRARNSQDLLRTQMAISRLTIWMKVYFWSHWKCDKPSTSQTKGLACWIWMSQTWIQKLFKFEDYIILYCMIVVWYSYQIIWSYEFHISKLGKIVEDPFFFRGGGGTLESLKGFLIFEASIGPQVWPPYGIVCRTPPTLRQRKTLWEVKVGSWPPER